MATDPRQEQPQTTRSGSHDLHAQGSEYRVSTQLPEQRRAAQRSPNHGPLALLTCKYTMSEGEGREEEAAQLADQPLGTHYQSQIYLPQRVTGFLGRCRYKRGLPLSPLPAVWTTNYFYINANLNSTYPDITNPPPRVMEGPCLCLPAWLHHHGTRVPSSAPYGSSLPFPPLPPPCVLFGTAMTNVPGLTNEP